MISIVFVTKSTALFKKSPHTLIKSTALSEDSAEVSASPAAVPRNRTAIPARPSAARQSTAGDARKRRGKMVLFLRHACPEPDSNRYRFPYRCLRPTRLPIPPSGHSIAENCGKVKQKSAYGKEKHGKFCGLRCFYRP